MKKVSYLLGVISCMFIFIGSMFKIQHWAGAAILLTTGILLFVLVFLPVALIHHYNTTAEKKNLWLHIITFLTALVVFTAGLFKILHWPAAGYLLLFSIPFPFLVFLPVYIYTSRKNNTSIRDYSYILMLLLLFALTSSLLTLNISKNILDEGVLSLREWNNLEQNSVLCTESLIAEAKASNNPMLGEIQKIHASSEMISLSIVKMIQGMAATVNPANEQAFDSEGKIDYTALRSLDVIVSGDQLFDSGEEGYNLKNKINAYRSLLLNAGSANTASSELITKLLDTADKDKFTWENADFGRMHLVWLLNSLTYLKSNIKICEAETIKSMLTKAN